MGLFMMTAVICCDFIFYSTFTNFFFNVTFLLFKVFFYFLNVLHVCLSVLFGQILEVTHTGSPTVISALYLFKNRLH